VPQTQRYRKICKRSQKIADDQEQDEVRIPLQTVSMGHELAHCLDLGKQIEKLLLGYPISNNLFINCRSGGEKSCGHNLSDDNIVA